MSSLDEKLYREAEVGEILNINVQTLRQWRCAKEGPAFLKIGRKSVRYPASALLEFINAGDTSGQQPKHPPKVSIEDGGD